MRIRRHVEKSSLPFLALLLLVLGLFLGAMAWRPALVADFVENASLHSANLVWPALISFLLGVFYLFFFTTRPRHRYFTRTLGPYQTSIDKALINQYLAHYWSARLPGREVSSEVRIRGSRLSVYAELPEFEGEKRRSVQKRVKEDLRRLFAERFGYRRRLALTLSFPD